MQKRILIVIFIAFMATIAPYWLDLYVLTTFMGSFKYPTIWFNHWIRGAGVEGITCFFIIITSAAYNYIHHGHIFKDPKS